MINPREGVEFTAESARRYIDSFVDPKANWDSYHSAAITPEAITAAKALLSLVQETPQPIPTNDGGIALCWVWNGEEVNIELGPDGKLV